jgi:hypothetical protein
MIVTVRQRMRSAAAPFPEATGISDLFMSANTGTADRVADVRADGPQR